MLSYGGIIALHVHVKRQKKKQEAHKKNKRQETKGGREALSCVLAQYLCVCLILFPFRRPSSLPHSLFVYVCVCINLGKKKEGMARRGALRLLHLLSPPPLSCRRPLVQHKILFYTTYHIPLLEYAFSPSVFFLSLSHTCTTSSISLAML